jgi:hypothetical protein
MVGQRLVIGRPAVRRLSDLVEHLAADLTSGAVPTASAARLEDQHRGQYPRLRVASDEG